MKKVKKKIVSVIPLSNIAKDRFDNIMDKFHSCKIEKETEDLFLLSSLNQQYIFWCPKVGNEHWKLAK
jgi:hypothetical protein